MKIMSPDYHQSYFIGFILEAVLWGSSTIIFGQAMYFSYFSCFLNKRKPVSTLLLSAMVALYAMSTAHFSLVFYNVYQGLMIQFYGIGIENHILEGADVLNYTTDLFGQAVLTYRCWVVWGKRWYVIVLPVFMSLFSYTFAMIGMGVYRTFAEGLPAGASSTKLVNASANIALGVPVGTDLLLTLLIIGRIYYLAQWSPELLISARRINSVLAIIIESGALVILVQLITSVLVLRGHPTQNIMLCVLAQIYCIAPTLIILRIGMGKAFDATSLNATITSLRYAPPTTVADEESKKEKDQYQASSSSGSGTVTNALDTNNRSQSLDANTNTNSNSNNV